MPVAPPLPTSLDPKDMKWARWITEKALAHETRITQAHTSATTAAQQAASAHTAVAVATEQQSTVIKIETPAGPPQVPSTPILATDHGTVTIKWDGQVHANLNYAPDAGDDLGSLQFPYAGFNHVNLYRSDSQDGTYALIGPNLGRAGSIVDGNVIVGNTYWYHFVSTDNLHVESNPGLSASVTVQGVDLGSLNADVTSAIQAAKDAGDAGLAAGQAGQQAAADATAASQSAAGDAAAALQAAQTAQQRADDAYAAAENATGTTQIYIGTTQPTDTSGQLLWVDTTGGNNTPKHYVNGNWVAITDAAAVAAANAAANAQTTANSAQTTANTAVTNAANAQTTANTALTSANGKNKVYFQATQPGTTGNVVGDTWFDTAHGNAIYQWNGTAWTAAALGSQAIGSGAIGTTQLTSSLNTSITNSISKTTTFYQTTQPSTTGRTAGDTWFDTANGYRISIWNGSAWALSTLGNAALGAGSVDTSQLSSTVASSITTAQTTATNANTAAGTAQTTANNAQTLAGTKNKVYFQASAPGTTGNVIGDSWYDTSNGNRLYQWNGTAWAAAQFGTGAIANGAVDTSQLSSTVSGNITTATSNASSALGNSTTALNTANGKNSVSYATTAPSNTYTGRVGDIWFVQDASGNVTGHYVWSGSAWVAQTLTNSVIASLDAGKITSGSIAAARIAAGTITGTMIAGTTITAGNIVSGTITGTQIAGTTITASNIAAGTITSAQIAANTITASQIAAGTITSASGVIGSLDAGAITTGTLSASRIGANSISASQMIAGTITAASGIIADAAITQAKIANLAVGTAQIADLAVADAKIATLTGSKIIAGTITTGKFQAGAITTNDIAAGSIDTNRLAAGVITTDKLQVGLTTPGGSSTNRVPADPTSNAFWSLVLQNKPNLNVNGTGFLGVTSTTAGLVFASQATAPYIYVVARTATPQSNKIHVVLRSTTGTALTAYVRWFSSATDTTGTTVALTASGSNNAYGTGYTYTFPATAFAYAVYIQGALNTADTLNFARVFEVIGNGLSGGQSAELSPAGIRLYDVNGQPAVDLTTASAQFLNIYDASGDEPQSIASIDNLGNGSFTSVTTDNGYDINGVLLTDVTDPHSLINATPNGSQWAFNVPLFDRGNRGVIYDVTWNSMNSVAIATGGQNLRIAQDKFTLEDGRNYEIVINLAGLQANETASNNVYLELQLSEAQLTGPTSGTQVARAVLYGASKGYYVFPSILLAASSAVTTINSTDLNNRLVPAGIPIYWQVDVNNSATMASPGITFNEYGNTRGLTVIDLGSSNLTRPTGTNQALANVTDRSTTGTASGSTSGGTTATSTTVTFTAKQSRTWNNSGQTIVSGTGQYTNGAAMYVGTGSTPMGSWFGQFRDSAGRTMASVLSGKTVTAATLTLKNNYTYSSSGSTNNFGTGSMDTAPNTIGTPSSNTFSASFTQGQTKGIALSSGIRTGLANGTVQSFVIGVQSGYGGVYGYYAGATQASPPKIAVTYH